MNETNNSRKFKSETFLSVKLSFQIILFVFSVVVFLSLITGGNLFGDAGSAINAFILGVFGHSAYPLFIAIIFFAIKIFSGKQFNAKVKPVICLSILFVSTVFCYHLLTTTSILNSADNYSIYLTECFNAGSQGIGNATGGGVLFGLLVYPLNSLFETTGSYIIFGLIFSLTVLVLFGKRDKHSNMEVKEYPSDYFISTPKENNEKAEFNLPKYTNPQYQNQNKTEQENNYQQKTTQPQTDNKKDKIIPVPKKLFVGFIDDYVNTKAKKTKHHNKSYDILYSSKPETNEKYKQQSMLDEEEIKNQTLGNTSYVDTFGEDFESKKKFILTPIDNILRPSQDYGTGRIFPINTNKEEQTPEKKPPRINHNMGGRYTDNQTQNTNLNTYQKYANEYKDNNTTSNVRNDSFRKIEKPDYLDNLSNLMNKYSNNANEKSAFIGDMQNDNEENYNKENSQYNNEQNNYDDRLIDNIDNSIKINRPFRNELPLQKENPLKYQTEISVKKDTPTIKSPYIAPSVSLMNEILYNPNDTEESYEEKVTVLENTLNEFKVPAKVVSVTPGPTVTRYELQMPPGVPVSKLTSRANDIAMCLASNGEIRIEAPIPGKSLLGIELPNKKRQKVGLREVIDSKEFINTKSPVTFALGKEITGKNSIIDFTKMPHLLVAGSTGSGKSVCLNTLIISILYKSSPEDVRLILIDPKRVEFNVYNGLPHLMLKDVITDAEKAISAFNWAINEMDRRFELFKQTVSKDIIAYNEKVKKNGGQKLPRILIIVDELAELMMINKRELEEKIKKISQLSRAAGIHLILATQRPSVDIITGVIKANLSSRVTFKLMTQADSRTVLDCSGAEKLLGEGDMIFLSNTMPKPIRLQGPFISTAEVEGIVEFIKNNNEAYFDEDIEQKIYNPITENEDIEQDQSEELDKYFVDALKLAIDSGQISISMVQRRFAVGYSRAGKIIDEMERQKFISPFEGSKPRQVLISREEFERRFGTGS